MGNQTPPPRKFYKDTRCLEPNPDEPTEKCLHWAGPGHEGEHTWWFCLNEFGDFATLDCVMKRGHDGEHTGHW